MAMSNEAGTPDVVGALACGVAATVKGWCRQVSANTSLAERARASKKASSMRPAKRRLLPSLPIKSGPGAGATEPIARFFATSLPLR